MINPGNVEKDALVEARNAKESGAGFERRHHRPRDRTRDQAPRRRGEARRHRRPVGIGRKKLAGSEHQEHGGRPEKESGSKKKGGKKNDNPMDGLEL